MEKYKIEIAQDFSPNLGVRYKSLGLFSGEQFYDELLEKRFKEAKAANEQLHIYLDGASPYGSSFLDESFGKLARNYSVSEVSKILVFHTINYKWIVEFIRSNIWK
jgi:hypothetical protein